MRRRYAEAVAGGALHHITASLSTVADEGVAFVVRRAIEAARNPEARTGYSAGPNPFQNPDPALVVAEVSPTHRAVLNRYAVIDNHLLVITRRFAEQDAPLDAADFDAFARCMAGAPTLGFYNAGYVAGASQRHKHLQVVPLPLGPGPCAVPIEPALERLPFRHGLARLDGAGADDPAARAPALLERYRELMAAGVDGTPYNLLVTRSWMLVVARSREAVEGVMINALAYAGSFFVRDEAQMAALRRVGPLTMLRRAALDPQA